MGELRINIWQNFYFYVNVEQRECTASIYKVVLIQSIGLLSAIVGKELNVKRNQRLLKCITVGICFTVKERLTTMKNKPITWLKLWQRLGKQPLCKTKGKYVKVYKDGIIWYCELVFDHNGSDFYLVPIKVAERDI